MALQRGSGIIKDWPGESQEAAQLVIDTYGEPHEATESLLLWHKVGPWKRIVASRTFYEHHFPAPHVDSVESFIDYRVPVDMFTNVFACARTAGWTAHVMEQHKDNRLIRPKSDYVGPTDLKVEPIETRG